MESAELQGELWGAAAKDWADLQEPLHKPLFKAMLAQAGVTSRTRLLDAGCGAGGASVLAVGRGARVSGLDAAPAMIEIARERIPAGDFRVGDIQALPYEDNAFDAVLAANSLQFSKNPSATLQELRRVTAEEGKVVVGLFGAPDKVQYRAIITAARDVLRGPQSMKDPFALSEPGVLENLIRKAGLTVQTLGEVKCPFKYPDFETLWRVNLAAGPFQAALKFVGEEKLRTAIWDAAQPFRDGKGNLLFENSFLYISATR